MSFVSWAFIVLFVAVFSARLTIGKRKIEPAYVFVLLVSSTVFYAWHIPIYIVILLGVPMGFLAAFHPEVATRVASGFGAWLQAVPDSLWALFGAGYLGYTCFRTIDKIKGGAK